jgi:hypothetical protein
LPKELKKNQWQIPRARGNWKEEILVNKMQQDIRHINMEVLFVNMKLRILFRVLANRFLLYLPNKIGIFKAMLS